MAATTTVRASEWSRDVLRKYAEERGISMADALDEVVAEWEKKHFFQRLNDAYAELRSDPDAREEELAERRLWDQTLTDNLPDNYGESEPR